MLLEHVSNSFLIKQPEQYYCKQIQIAEVERLQQANMVTGAELNAIQALASRNFFSPHMIEDGTSYSHPDKKILHLGYSIFCLLISLVHIRLEKRNVECWI